ncbi:DUF1002 domain-containing protein [Staphylococcus aureus]|uniref:DUF1002 domain-containing protein n=1 Tax=Staphylococcus aureus TaxID=1280 RepID=UPI001E2D3514|nr:DUF1002 domain-containing protein [Staphylococcus aureus]MCD4872512.1 DUF1002 domain-containing protein [Staphylococcus aureus]MCD4977033.1 DUF1002 domain-containing protein [Staphylococcus aureus]MCD5159042.1 DUF1002 domain-containing protein [Staphylococcus aureus]WAA00625.1 DUF1002 domain-containing protein [Staphylococcus aureus]HDE4216032.1 DUF1002 domain-containing protein [Staphylococcus aureus]
MKNKIVISLLALNLLTVNTALAEVNRSNNENWDKPIFIQGNDLKEDNLEKTKEQLNVNDSYERFFVNTNDVERYVPNSSQLSYIYSSATIEKKRFGKGVDVEIKTPENITKVTDLQYRNAAITAGIQNSNINIASIEPVTGEGALAGIFKVYSIKGNQLNDEDIENANKEMRDIANINEENKNVEGYSDEALNASIADIKQQLAEMRAKQDEQLTDNQVKGIVDEVLKNKGFNEILNVNQRNIITENMINIANSNSLNENPKSFESQAKDLSKSIQRSAGDKIEEAKAFVNSEEGKSFGQKFLDMLKSIIDSIVDFINRIVSFLQNLLK